jgi:hypothetical protein
MAVGFAIFILFIAGFIGVMMFGNEEMVSNVTNNTSVNQTYYPQVSGIAQTGIMTFQWGALILAAFLILGIMVWYWVKRW